jgi:hypothetical protein
MTRWFLNGVAKVVDELPALACSPWRQYFSMISRL